MFVAQRNPRGPLGVQGQNRGISFEVKQFASPKSLETKL